MFKIKQKIVFGLLLMSTAMIFMNYQVKADNGEAIFDQQTLEEVESKIEGKRIFQDKSYDGSENIKAERRPTGVYPTRKGVCFCYAVLSFTGKEITKSFYFCLIFLCIML